MIIEAGPLTTIWEVVEELNINNFIVVRNLKQIGKVKKLDKWVPHELTTNQKNHYFEVSSLIIGKKKESFLDWIVTCDKNIDFYPTIRDDQLSGCTKKQLQSTFQSQTCTRKAYGHYLVVYYLVTIWSTTAFWILPRPLHLRSMFSKSMRCTENCKACRRDWSTERTQFFSRTRPDCTSHNQCFKSLKKKLSYEVLPHLPYPPDLSQTNYHVQHLNNFCRKKASTTSRRQKMLSKSSANPEAWTFMKKQTYLSLVNLCWL